MRLFSWIRRRFSPGREPTQLLLPPATTALSGTEPASSTRQNALETVEPDRAGIAQEPVALVSPDAPAVIEPEPLETILESDPELVAAIAAPESPPPEIERSTNRSPQSIPAAIRSRLLYFAPAAYAPTAAATAVLAPDLVFHIGFESRPSITGPSTRSSSIATPAPAVIKPKLEPRLLEEFATSQESEPQFDSSGKVLTIDPMLFTFFIGGREGGPGVPLEAMAEYLTHSPLLAQGVALRDIVVRRWLSGGPPLDVTRFYCLARQINAHPGTALLLCHNAAKAFARGGEAIAWKVVSRSRGEYSDGKSIHVATALHHAGVLKTGPFANPSIFYLLFSAAEFGVSDPGDYYRCFAAASAVWYAATGCTRVPVIPPSPAAQERAQLLSGIARQMKTETDPTPAHRGWLWINAATFLESAIYDRAQHFAQASAMVNMRGACFGLSEAKLPADPPWDWSVPATGSGLRRPFTFPKEVAQTLRPAKHPVFNG